MSARNARRLAAKRAAAKRAFTQGIGKLVEQSAGVMEFLIISPDDFMQTVVASMHGDQHATTIAQILAQAVGRLLDIPDGGLCLACPPELDLEQGPPTFVVTRPAGNEAATAALASALCAECAAKPNVIDRVVEGLRRIWPDARAIRIGDHHAGHA